MRLVYFLSVIGLLGCNKFEHTDLSNSGCELCGYAQSLEGEYRGEIGSVYTWPNDSVTVLIEQVFLGQSSLQDSLIIHLKMTYTPDNKPSYIDTIRLNSYNGETLDYLYLDGTKLRNDVYSISKDNIRFEGWFYSNHSQHAYRVGKLYKQ